MNNHIIYIHKRIPTVAYLIISAPVLFIFAFFSFFKSENLDTLRIIIAVFSGLALLVLVNGFFYFIETKDPVVKLENNSLFLMINGNWQEFDKTKIIFFKKQSKIIFNKDNKSFKIFFKQKDFQFLIANFND